MLLLRHCADEPATERLGAALARALLRLGLPPLRITLQGDLGAGKTTLVRGLLRALGVRGRIKSPSYALVETYHIDSFGLELNHCVGITAYHIDLYRFYTPDEWLDAGLGEALGGDALCLVEWPERAEGLPPADLQLRLTADGPGRTVELRDGTPAGAAVIESLASAQADV